MADNQSQNVDETQYEEEHPRVVSRWVLLTAVPAWLVSLVVHLAVVLLMFLFIVDTGNRDQQTVTINDASDAEEIEEFVMEEFEPIDMQTLEFDTPPDQPEDAIVTDEIVFSDFNEMEAATMQQDLADFADETAPFSDLMSEMAGVDGNATAGRGQAQRTQMLREGGGTGASEEAVVFGLKWIAEHQMPNGTWSFDHRKGARKPGSKNWGSIDGPRGATAMALLPFLGAGHTHKEGKYKKEVEAGLKALISQMKVRGDMGDLTESGGTMYSHGLGTITLCEAYAMTQDKQLLLPAQAALNFVTYAQDPVGGGWRYQPRQPGDTSVVGWQVIGLKSGQMGYLNVNKNTVAGAIKFLDGVQADNGAFYGYSSPGKGKATTAIGLLSRMYLGWKKEHPPLEAGVDFLSKSGPDKTNMYYNYYATQVMRQYGGPKWDAWNEKMRDQLVDTQIKQEQPEAGSWFFNGSHGDRGGRLYDTALSVLTLEVYYRHLPIYKQAASEEEFPL